MSFTSPFRKLRHGLLQRAKTAPTPKKARRRRSTIESLEQRQLLTWVATFASATGQLTVQGVGLSSDTGVLKVDPNSGEILLDGNNSGNFVDTGANLATINTSIQIEANTTIKSNFIIDNNDGAFFEAPATFPALTPLFVYTGSTAAQPSSNLTITGQSGVANTFNVTPNKTTQNMGVVVLSEPPNVLNQQNILTVDYAGVSGNLTLNGINGQSGNDTVILNDNGAATDWTVNGNTIDGPLFPPAPTVPPTPAPLPGTVGDVVYQNVANLQFNNVTSGDLLTINSAAANTTASDAAAETTVVNYNQPLAYPVSIVGVPGTADGTLDVVGALGGGNDFYVDAGSVAYAAAGTKPQYNQPFTHLGSDLTYTSGTLKVLQVAGNGGDNTITVQVPPILFAPYTSQALPATLNAFGGVLPPVLANTQPPATTVGATLLRVLGNAPGPLTTGADTITVGDFAAGGAGKDTVNMSQIAGVVIYGEGGNDTLTNASVGNTAQGILPVPALFIGGSGNDTMTGGAGSDMFLGGGAGHNTLVSKAVSTPQQPTTTYFFPHQDQLGNIYDQLLNPSAGDTTSTLTGVGGNQMVVTGAVDPALSVTATGDLDMGNLANVGVGGAGGGGGNNNKNGGQTLSYPTVPPGNVTAPLYMVTSALTALEDAMGVAKGPFPANEAAFLEFGGKVNLTSQFATYAAFVGRAYNDFLIDRGGSGQFGQPVTASGGANGGGNGGTGINPLIEEGVSLVSPAEINYWVGQGQQGLTVQQMQAQILASNELQTVLPDPEQWIRFLWESVTGQFPSDQVLAAEDAILANGNTPAARYAIALNLLTTPQGEVGEINDAYSNVVPGGGAPSGSDLAAIEADLSSGESLTQVAATMSTSFGSYLNYETTNQTGFVGFVAGVYETVLHRPANPSDLTFWSSESAAGLSKAQIATIILDSAEARGFIINDAYEAYLGRPADPVGMAFWQAEFAAGMTDEVFIGQMIASTEYYVNNGGTSQGYVGALYRTFLGRTAMQSDIDYWVSQLAMSPRGAMQARADIAVDFQQSTEFRTKLIDQWYQLYDGRAPSAAELSAAMSMFLAGATQEGVQAAILAAK